MKKYSRVYKFVLAIILTTSLFCTSCSRAADAGVVRKDGFYFDTVISVSIYGENEDTANKALDACFAMAEKYEQLFSNTVSDSDVSRINKGAGEYVKVDPETVELIKKGIEYGEISGGLFDITMGAVISMWDFSGESQIPGTLALDNALSTVSYENIWIKNDSVSLSSPGAMIDLGGIAKGYIADRMKEELLGFGIESAIISLGGNVLLVGSKPDGSDFNVGIQDPFKDEGSAIKSVMASDVSVVTSGVYQRYFEMDGVIYHHILDPNDGYPVNNGLSSVSVICDSSVDADALSTTCFVMGLDAGKKLIESIPDTEAIFITDEGDIIKTL